MIVGCDSAHRAGDPVDQGLGDLFVVDREAGNVVDNQALGSIEYAVEHLHAPRWSWCSGTSGGAIAAARDTATAHAHAEGHIESLVAAIRPAVDATAGQDAEATCRANVRQRGQGSCEPPTRSCVTRPKGARSKWWARITTSTRKRSRSGR